MVDSLEKEEIKKGKNEVILVYMKGVLHMYMTKIKII